MGNRIIVGAIAAAAVLALAPQAFGQSSPPVYGNLGHIELVYEDGLDDVYEIEDSLFKLDGVAIHPTLPRGSSKPSVIYSGVALPGQHDLSVVLKLKGASSVIFTYLEGYTVHLRQAVKFGAKRGQSVRIVIKTYDRGFTYDFTQRAGMKVERVPLGPVNAASMAPATP